MLTKFAPRAYSPPSPNRKHCTSKTAAITTAPAQGPSTTAASTPPSRCPETPGPTGKLTIWAAKTNAAIIPISTVVRSRGARSIARSPIASPPAPITAVVAQTLGESTASGMCMEDPSPFRPAAIRMRLSPIRA